jgi:hypothetical protein
MNKLMSLVVSFFQTTDWRRKTCPPYTRIGRGCPLLGIKGRAGSQAWGILRQLCQANQVVKTLCQSIVNDMKYC